MQYTVLYYNFPAIETYENLQVTFRQKYFSQGYVKVVAEIKPSISKLLDFLNSRSIIGSGDIRKDSNIVTGEITYYAVTRKGSNFINALRDFSSTKWNFQLSASAYSFGDALAGGDYCCSEKAVNKIKKQLREQYPKPDVLRDFTAYLQQRGLLY